MSAKMQTIVGLQWLVVGLCDHVKFGQRMLSKDAFVVASVDGVEEFRLPLNSIPMGLSIEQREPEWYDLSKRPLPLDRTRFNLPAWALLRFKLQDDLAQKR